MKIGNPTATATDYMKALENVFKTDLMGRFRHMFQNEGENLSASLPSLNKWPYRVFFAKKEFNCLRLIALNRLREVNCHTTWLLYTYG